MTDAYASEASVAALRKTVEDMARSNKKPRTDGAAGVTDHTMSVSMPIDRLPETEIWDQYVVKRQVRSLWFIANID